MVLPRVSLGNASHRMPPTNVTEYILGDDGHTLVIRKR
jgi:hypothetical protein